MIQKSQNKIGQIIRIISNLYTVKSENQKFECRARGKFKNESITPLVGDIVEFDGEQKYILDIKHRKNELSRPPISNVDKCIVVTSCKQPDFSHLLLDKMLTNIIYNDITPIICITKYDLLSNDEQKEFDSLIEYYNKIGIRTFINNNIANIKKELSGSVVVLTGQTGAGKSSLLNSIDETLNLATNEISFALGRGKHTTRHVELFEVDDFYIADTPGFSALDTISDKDNIRFTFKEFNNDGCKFRDCKHINEIGCAVKEQVMNQEILESRYQSYRNMVEK